MSHVDEAPAATVAAERWWRKPTRLWSEPPRWGFYGICCLPALALLYSASVPGSNFLVWGAAVLFSALLAVIWFARLVSYFLRRRRVSWWFAVAPLAGALLLFVDATALPLQVRFALSKSAFEAAADHPQTAPSRIGSYHIISVDTEGDQVVFTEGYDCGFLCAGGFVYAPSGVRSDSGMTLTHLSGPWWAYWQGD